MGITIEFDFHIEGDELPAAFLDGRELELMFDNTRQSLGAGLQRKFRDVVCGEHAEAPRFKVSGTYDRQLEELDIHYHVDTCCQFFLLRVMQIMNQRV